MTRTHLKIPFRLRYGIFGCGSGLRLNVPLVHFGVRPVASPTKSRISPLKANFEMGSSDKRPCTRTSSVWGKQGTRDKRSGITLLLVIILLSAIMSISLGIFNIVMGELRISGEISDSFIAFYAADQGIERVLYLDRNARTICGTPGQNCFTESGEVESGGCYTARVSRIASTTDIVVAGQYRCGTNPARVVKRGFELVY